MVWVIKIGGTSHVPMQAIVDDVCTLVDSGTEVVLVHGGSSEGNALCEALGTPPKFIRSPEGIVSRHTDSAVLKIITMAFTGSVNPELVTLLQVRGVNAIGLSGIDAALVTAKIKPVLLHKENDRTFVVRNNRTGGVTSVNHQLIQALLKLGLVPVISPPALDPDAGAVNVDADRMAAAIAGALEAERLVFVSNVRGVLRDENDPGSVVVSCAYEDVSPLIDSANGGMKTKLIAAQSALRDGAQVVHIANAECSHPVASVVSGSGTTFYRSNRGEVPND